MATVDTTVTDLAQRARETGRLGIDTEFMGEGRYRPLLCLVQVAVDGRRAATSRVAVLDPLEDDFDPAPLAEVLADPDVEIVLHAGRQDVALLRRVWSDRGHATSSTRRSPPGSPGCARSSATRRCCRELLGVRLRKSASFTRWDARPLSRRAGRATRARTCCTCSQLADALQERLARRGRLELGARGVPRAGGRLRRARRRRDLRAAAARQLARPRPARRRARARRVARGTSPATATGRCRASCRRGARRDRQAPAAEPRAPRADPRPQRGHAAPPRATRSSTPSSAGASATPIPSDGVRRPPPDRGRRAADRAGRGARARARGRGRARLRAARRRAPTCSGSSPRCATARPGAATCARCRAGGASSSATSCSSCSPGGGRCASGPTAGSTSAPDAPGGNRSRRRGVAGSYGARRDRPGGPRPRRRRCAGERRFRRCSRRARSCSPSPAWRARAASRPSA